MVSGLLSQLERSRDLGFLGPGAIEDQARLSALVLDAAHRAATESPESGPTPTLLDLGSGGGLPGLIAVAEGAWSRVVLLDRSERRCSFLRDAVRRIDPSDGETDVVCGEAETLGHAPGLRECFDAVIARGFGPPSATIESSSAFVRVGGVVLVTDPPGGRAWPVAGCGLLSLVIESASTESPSWTIFRKVSGLDADLPRRAGVPVRRPLFTI